jgi:hypothetical protein
MALDRSRYDGIIPPDFDRSDPAGNLVDIGTGAKIGDVQQYGGWIPLGDGLAARVDDPAFNPHLRGPTSTAPKADRSAIGPDIASVAARDLLLF